MADNFIAKVGQWPAQTRSYFEELQQEMRRVTWPNPKQVRATTAVVIATIFAFAGYFLVVDFVLGRSITKLYDVLGK
ncbi:MAG TPA: preprotein translocase subunit SecE [Bryobacteraceae bacterium]|nr:preprotein translocase subunit SecE [Bryobacteraceae bacterium]